MRNNKKRWIVIYTRPKWEKKVNQLLNQQGIDTFCPLVKMHKQWSDRNKIVEVPLFSSYVFVQTNTIDQFKIKQVAGVVDLVYHCGVPAEITEDEIMKIKLLMQNDHFHELEQIPYDQVSKGDRIKVKKGILSDWQGEVINVKGKSIVMVLENFNCALVAKINIPQVNLLPV
ncbi:MAG TPA: UpxY family transcription antiterminator [Pseudosphingobacterium sp.]|nr:UpxY family transcription antiterminator [Pseudosphingobacterium sp.]